MEHSDRYAFVDFAIVSAAGFARLIKVVDELARQKTDDAIFTQDFWLQYFTEADRTEFWWPTDSQLELWNKFWFSTPLPQRHSPGMPVPKWDFGSMIDAIWDGDYDLVGVRELKAGKGRLEIDPHAYPFGGIDAVRTLVRAFGHTIIGFNDGTGYQVGDPLPPLWNDDMPPLAAENPSLWHRLKRR